MARLYGKKTVHLIVSHIPGVGDACHDAAKEVTHKAEANLAEARASTQWHKIFGPDHLTKVDCTRGEVDSFANLEAPNAMAIEFGHEPSGVFGPGGRYGHIETKAPEGLYILSHAAGLTS